MILGNNPELQEIICAWRKLPKHIKEAISSAFRVCSESVFISTHPIKISDSSKDRSKYQRGWIIVNYLENVIFLG
jgi:hypothetical protein